MNRRGTTLISRESVSEIKKNRWRNALFGILSGFLFLGVFAFRYHQIPDGLYKNRDDAIITFSHARNLADFGSIGINPSGERVEGFSSPAQFMLFFAAYKATRISYETFTQAQTFVFSFLLGFLFLKFFKPDYIFGGLAALLSAILLTMDTSFIEWHGSGMENAVTHVAFLAGLYALYRALDGSGIRPVAVLIVFLATIARTEAMYYFGPLLLIFAFLYNKKHGNRRGWGFASIIFILWGVFNLFRYLYFGAVFPNTAYAQRIDVVSRLKSLLRFEPEIYQQSYRFMKTIFLAHHGYLILICLPLAFFAARRARPILVLLFAFVGLSWLNPFFFGPSSLDLTRTTTPLAVLAVLFCCMSLASLRAGVVRFGSLVLFAALSLVITGRTAPKPYNLLWAASDFRQFQSDFLALKREHQFFRPTVGNVDLGLVSWSKDFNIVDLGKLGSPVISRLKTDRSVADYLFDFAVPDFLEIHDNWSCRYAYLFQDPRFEALYEPVKARRTDWIIQTCPQDERIVSGLWVRRDMKIGSPSRERLLVDRLTNDPSIRWLKEEIDFLSRSSPASSSAYISRTAYRFLPEFAARGELHALRKLFVKSASAEYDLAILGARGSGGWHRKVISFLEAYGMKRIVQEFGRTGVIEPKNIERKSGFYDDGVWTKGKAALEDLDLPIGPGRKYFIVRTYGYRPASVRSAESLGLELSVNGRRLRLSQKQEEGFSYYFDLPGSLTEIRSIRVRSLTFVPKKLGLNSDGRRLGLDIRSYEVK